MPDGSVLTTDCHGRVVTKTTGLDPATGQTGVTYSFWDPISGDRLGSFTYKVAIDSFAMLQIEGQLPGDGNVLPEDESATPRSALGLVLATK